MSRPLTCCCGVLLFFGVALAGCAPTVTESGPVPAEATRVGATAAHGEVAGEPALDVTRFAPVDGGPLRVVTTVGQITDIVESLGGDRVSVTQIIPGNDDPHLFVPSAGDVTAFGSAHAIFYNGLNLEGQMGRTFEQMRERGVATVPVAAGIPLDQLRQLQKEGHPITDPHIWFDPDLWAQAAGNVAATLSALDPAGKPTYDRNLAAYQDRLAALADWGRAAVATVPAGQRKLVTSHDAFGYFGRVYGLEVQGLQGLSTQAEAGTRDINDLVDLILREQVPAVFVEGSVSPEAIQSVVEAVRADGGDVRIGGSLYSDSPDLRGTPAGSYPGMVLWNLATVASALGGRVDQPLPTDLATYQPLVDRAAAGALR